MKIRISLQRNKLKGNELKITDFPTSVETKSRCSLQKHISMNDKN